MEIQIAFRNLTKFCSIGGLTKPESGAVLIDQVDLRSMADERLRQK